MCAFEERVLRAARATLRGRETIDVNRISGAVIAATREPVGRVRQTQSRQWIGWRAAASIALVAVGATSIAVWNGVHGGTRGGVDVTRGIGAGAAVTAGAGTLGQGVATGRPSAASSGSAAQAQQGGATAVVVPVASSGLTAAGGLSDLSDAELESLLGDIGSLDASRFDEPQEVIPAIGGSEGVQ
jgi:hypothetical protein